MQENRQEKSQIKQKILLYLKTKGVSEYSFYKDSGVTRGVLQQNNGISEDNITRFLAYAPDVNPTWLLTGEGEMLKGERKQVAIPEHDPYPVNTSDVPVSIGKDSDFVAEPQQSDADYIRNTRPRIPFDAAAGALSIATESAMVDQCERAPVIRSLPDYDFTIMARGDSMLPVIKSGDELACRFVRESGSIRWGETYVIDSVDGVVVKRLHKGADGSIICKSFNPDFEDFSIERSDVYHLAIVVGLLRRL